MLLAEDLVLLLLDDESGALKNSAFVDTGIGGALLVDLALGGHVEVRTPTGRWSRAKVHTTAADPPPDPVLVAALAVVAEKERTAQDLVSRLGRKRRLPLLVRLEAAGLVRREQTRVLGLVPRRRWPAVDGGHERDLRRALGDALVRGVQPEDRTAALIGLLSGLQVVHKVVDREGLSAGTIKRRAKEIAEGDWAAKAVREAVAAASAAVAVAAVAAAGAAGSS